MTDNFGSLLYYDSSTYCSDDPYKGYKVIPRLAQTDCPGRVLFQVPDDKSAFKIDESMFTYKLNMPSNYVPDNDVCAKMVKKMELKILDNRIFSSFDQHEYTFFSHFVTKLNYSPLAQEMEQFVCGRFDAYDVDADDLNKIRLPHNGLTLAQNRKRYATKKWIRSKEQITVGTLGNQTCEELVHEYRFRAPIMHGLARQPRVLPTGSRCQIEVTLAEIGRMLMEVDEYQECQIEDAFAEKFAWPFQNIKTRRKTIEHTNVLTCDCTKEMFESEEDSATKRYNLKQIYDSSEGTLAYSLAISCIDKTRTPKTITDDEGNTKTVNLPQQWRSHSYEIDEAALEPSEKTGFKRFWRKKKLKATDEAKPIDYTLEAVYCTPAKNELPLKTSTKGEGIMPFFYPRFTRRSLTDGLHVYDLDVSEGPFPKMIVITGMPHKRLESCDFKTCVTKTSMNEPGFKIKEITAFVNFVPEFRTPWDHPQDHYINYMRVIGRWKNKALAMGVDFFHFQDNNWMIPLPFDDRVGNSGVVRLRIEFEGNLGDKWDACVFHMPRNELFLDANRNGKFIIYLRLLIFLFLEATVLAKSAAGRKRKTAGLPDYEVCKKKKTEVKKSKEAAGAPGGAKAD